MCLTESICIHCISHNETYQTAALHTRPSSYYIAPSAASLLHSYPLPLSCCSSFHLPAIIFPPSFDHLPCAQPLSRSPFSSIIPSPSISPLPTFVTPFPHLLPCPPIPPLVSPSSSPHLILPDRPSAFLSWGQEDGG